MSFLKNIMAGLGIGASRVDLILPKREFRHGEVLEGTLVVVGGDVDQRVDEIYLNLVVEFKGEEHYHVKVVDNQRVAGSLELPAGAPTKELKFSYRVPNGIPISSSQCKYRFELGLDIKNAIDPKDVEEVRIMPGLEMETVLAALDSLGFKHKFDSGEIKGELQKFEFVPTSFMRGKLDELEVMFRFRPDGLLLYLEIDKKARGLMGSLVESMELDERHVHLLLPFTSLLQDGRPQIAEVGKTLAEFIEKEYNRIL